MFCTFCIFFQVLNKLLHLLVHLRVRLDILIKIFQLNQSYQIHVYPTLAEQEQSLDASEMIASAPVLRNIGEIPMLNASRNVSSTLIVLTLWPVGTYTVTIPALGFVEEMLCVRYADILPSVPVYPDILGMRWLNAPSHLDRIQWLWILVTLTLVESMLLQDHQAPIANVPVRLGSKEIRTQNADQSVLLIATALRL